MRVMDLTGRAERLSLTVEASPAHEFLVSLCAYGLPHAWATYEIGPSWFEEVRRSGSGALWTAWERIGRSAGKIWVNLLGLAVQDPPAATVEALLNRVRELSALELRLSLMGYHVPAYQTSISREALRLAAEGDPAATDRLLRDGCYFGGHADEMPRGLLSLGISETRDAALEVLERWAAEVFPAHEQRVTAALERDAESKRSQLATASPEQLVESASGVQYSPDPSIRQVYLIPQVAMRPWVLLCEHDDVRLFAYPVADESLPADPTAPPPGLVRVHKALGDEKRLRMLKAVATSTATLQELADRFGLPKSTAHHHLAMLRAAGLIRVSSDYERRYSLRRDVLPESRRLLDAYLS